MKVQDKVILVTGGGAGIGAAMARRFAAENAQAVVVTDIDQSGVQEVAAEIGGHAYVHNVADEAQTAKICAEVIERFGGIDLYCSNAGIFIKDPGGVVSSSNEDWQRIWEINVMSHIYAVRSVLPHMIERGSGHWLITSSAAGLLNQVGSAPYGVTKHAAVGFAESIAIAHAHQGIGVQVLCPQAVRTPMVENLGGPGVAGLDGMLEPEALAGAVIDGLDHEKFLILPHPTVGDYMRHKAGDYDRWLGAMQKLHARFEQ